VPDAPDSGDFLSSGLAALGIEADETERAVIAATHAVFWEPILDLLAFDTSEIEPERDLDLSRAP
jgi:hypothetical protein